MLKDINFLEALERKKKFGLEKENTQKSDKSEERTTKKQPWL